ncbi:NUMOD4 domain-containing protein [Anaerovoracaceae bacterium 41-7]
MVKIREKLKRWAEDNDFYITVPMNPIASKVINEKMRLVEPQVHISRKDVEFINNLFDTQSEKLTALSVLCYAKAYADTDGKFKLSQRMFSHWIGMNSKTVRKYLKTLENMGFISLYEVGNISSWYQKTVVSQLNTYQAKFPIESSGEFELTSNNIIALYENLFLDKCSQRKDDWIQIPGYDGWYYINSDGDVKVIERTIGGRKFPPKYLKPFKSSSGKLYYNLMENGSQRKISLEKIQSLISQN